MTGPELALVFGHVIVKDAKGTIKERWLFPTEEILRSTVTIGMEDGLKVAKKIFERLYKEVKGPNRKQGIVSNGVSTCDGTTRHWSTTTWSSRRRILRGRITQVRTRIWA
ncbi:hypothetical protein Hypma_006954 [Hypsizygus marmoreus]|uniref:Uncharacterized protein n=1 Tax=Hypsizygus marmoreus TaxID=39966 RepID=A0A369K3R4_HYPMA|nr:hypothetical protein Hypma_006954 [Hypsizygus marmoreus]